MNNKQTIQRIGIAAMLLAILGFAFFRLLRIDLPAKRKVVITYDSNLRDKIVKRTRERANGDPDDHRYRAVAEELRKIESDIERGNAAGSLAALRGVEESTRTVEEDDNRTLSVNYESVETGVRSVERAVRDGRNDEARKMLLSLIEEMEKNGSDQ